MSAPRRPDTKPSAADLPAAAGHAEPTIRDIRTDSELAATIALPVTPVSEPSIVDPSPRPLSGDRYAVERTLGAGGMGEVLLCKDAWLGRDVAMKVMHSSVDAGSEGRARFLREARVQGQLEHPSVVPVYDIASGTGGAPYFTMKRIQGLTLRAVLDRLAKGDAATRAQFGRRKLIAALSQACLAVGFAHKRGVIHRDLKPDNLMLGEFGEVYVLDWGVARPFDLVDEPSGDEAPVPVSKRGPLSLPNDGLPGTLVGSLVGTPGYMSPEQARGEIDLLSARTDVYALGCILFEILTLAPVHDARDVPALILSAITKQAPRPSEAAPGADIPPELDAICERALALEPDERFASAREMSDALERFMDGERDAEMRKELARDHLRTAGQALEIAAAGGDGAEEARSNGMRELGRALALDPTSEEAMQLVTRIVMAAPSELPQAAEEQLKGVELEDRRKGVRRMLGAFLGWNVFIPFVLWAGVKSTPMIMAIIGCLILLGLYAGWMARTGNVRAQYMRHAIFGTFVLNGLIAVLFGPLFIVPGAACVTASAFMVSLRPNFDTRRYLCIAMFAAVFVPALLEWAGVVPPSMSFEDGTIRLLPRAVYFPPIPTHVFLAVVAVVQIVTTIVLVGGAVETLVAAERRNFAQAYRLGQLLPVKRS